LSLASTVTLNISQDHDLVRRSWIGRLLGLYANGQSAGFLMSLVGAIVLLAILPPDPQDISRAALALVAVTNFVGSQSQARFPTHLPFLLSHHT